MSKPGKVLKALCKSLGVRLTVKRGKKRVYKSVAVLKRQCANKKKKVKRRRRRFGPIPTLPNRIVDSKGTYIGQIKDDKKHGTGIYTWTNGNKYVGEWKDGKRHGTGTYTWADGGVYVGDFKDGNFHGKGTYTYNSGSLKGDVYVGEFKDGKRNGYGKWTNADGSIYHDGMWKDGKPVR